MLAQLKVSLNLSKKLKFHEEMLSAEKIALFLNLIIINFYFICTFPSAHHFLSVLIDVL